jgi:hypothetical protein
VAGAASPAAAVTDSGNGHLTAITAAQRRLLTALTGRISTRLAAEFETLSRPESPNVGVTLAERGKRGRLEIPYTLLEEAERFTSVSIRTRSLYGSIDPTERGFGHGQQCVFSYGRQPSNVAIRPSDSQAGRRRFDPGRTVLPRCSSQRPCYRHNRSAKMSPSRIADRVVL